MTEIANLSTGELIEYEPVAPLELEMIIRELGERLERAIPTIKKLWGERYAAERKFIEEKAKAVIRSTADSVTEKRAEADLASLPFKHDFDNAKEVLHAAEELQKALTAKLYGYLNINKANSAAWHASGAGR